MATLEEGCQYGLSSNFSSFSNKSVVHVKLTDTSLKVIEDFVKKKVKQLCFISFSRSELIYVRKSFFVHTADFQTC